MKSQKKRVFVNCHFFAKNRRGMLLAEEVLKMVIALISIGLLAYLLFSLYNTNKNNDDLELAEESLSHLVEGINLQSSIVEIYNPKGWHLTSWSASGGQPLACSNLAWENCICICKGESANRCDKVGVCQESEFRLQQNIEISNPPITLQINQESKTIG